MILTVLFVSFSQTDHRATLTFVGFIVFALQGSLNGANTLRRIL
jgi:hypothetical protein